MVCQLLMIPYDLMLYIMDISAGPLFLLGNRQQVWGERWCVVRKGMLRAPPPARLAPTAQ